MSPLNLSITGQKPVTLDRDTFDFSDLNEVLEWYDFFVVDDARFTIAQFEKLTNKNFVEEYFADFGKPPILPDDDAMDAAPTAAPYPPPNVYLAINPHYTLRSTASSDFARSLHPFGSSIAEWNVRMKAYQESPEEARTSGRFSEPQIGSLHITRVEHTGELSTRSDLEIRPTSPAYHPSEAFKRCEIEQQRQGRSRPDGSGEPIDEAGQPKAGAGTSFVKPQPMRSLLSPYKNFALQPSSQARSNMRRDPYPLRNKPGIGYTGARAGTPRTGFVPAVETVFPEPSSVPYGINPPVSMGIGVGGSSAPRNKEPPSLQDSVGRAFCIEQNQLQAYVAAGYQVLDRDKRFYAVAVATIAEAEAVLTKFLVG